MSLSSNKGPNPLVLDVSAFLITIVEHKIRYRAHAEKQPRLRGPVDTLSVTFLDICPQLDGADAVPAGGASVTPLPR